MVEEHKKTAYKGGNNPRRNECGEWVTFNGEKIKLAEGYSINSGKNINDASSNDFVITPQGKDSFGEITKAVAEKVKWQSGRNLADGKIRLCVGDENQGLIYAKKHESEAKKDGYNSIEDLIADIASNFDSIYLQES